MTLLYVAQSVLPAAYALLPRAMQSRAATALLLAIGLQESRFMHRRQVDGPARSFWQFEVAGVRGVLTHRSTEPAIARVLATLQYAGASTRECYTAIEHHDVLAACFARLLLWTLPGPLPDRSDPGLAWEQYLRAWRPGRPHPETWVTHYSAAWELLPDRPDIDVGAEIPGGGAV